MSSKLQLLGDRWYELLPHSEQIRLWKSAARFNVVPAGRRSGKSEISKRKLVYRAMQGTAFKNPRFFVAAPTREQSKRIFWEDLKALVPSWIKKGRPRESDLIIPMLNGSSIWVCGLDRPERIEGQPWDGGVLDEYANTKEKAWGENIRPALSDRSGWCDLIGVPEGRNHYYDRYRYAMDSGDPNWAAYHWISADILPDEEIEAAKRELDPQTYQQEYEASFLYYSGRIYYQFNEREHCARLEYNPQRPLIFCFDFNVDPGVAVVCQDLDFGGSQFGTGVIGEVHIPRNSNTQVVCQKLVADWQHHNGRIICYGDATGGSRGSAKTSGSDWDLIKQELQPAFNYRVKFNVPKANPTERSRVNSMNTRLKSSGGDVRLKVDPSKAPNLVKDFEGVVALEGGSGQIDKKSNLKLTHLSDALGYFIVREYPVISNNDQISTHRQRIQ